MGRENPATEACTLPTSSARFGLGFSPTYLRPQTKENDLEGEGLEDRLFSVRFVLVGSFGRWHIHSSSIFFVDPPVVLYPPLSPPLVLRALRYIVVALTVLARISLRYQ